MIAGSCPSPYPDTGVRVKPFLCYLLQNAPGEQDQPLPPPARRVPYSLVGGTLVPTLVPEENSSPTFPSHLPRTRGT